MPAVNEVHAISSRRLASIGKQECVIGAVINMLSSCQVTLIQYLSHGPAVRDHVRRVNVHNLVQLLRETLAVSSSARFNSISDPLHDGT